MTTIVLPANKKGPSTDSEQIGPNSRSTYPSSRHHSLKRWMTTYPQRTCTRTRTKHHSDTINGTTAATFSDNHHLLPPLPPPPILILDGGVSTHLEQKLRTAPRTTPAAAPAAFSHRQLWSSSLLLTPRGRADIRSAHADFYGAGSDVVSTVTYQCSHFHCCDGDGGGGVGHSPEPPLPSVAAGPALPTTVGHRFEKEDIDDMLRTGVHLANQARRQSYRGRDEPSATQKYAGTSSSNQRENGAEGREEEEEEDGGSKRGNHRSSGNSPGTSRYIAASMGCYGAALANGEEYTGDYGDDCSIESLVRFHRRRFDLFWNMSSRSLRSDDDCDGVDSSRGLAVEEGLRNSICLVDALAFETVPCLMEVRAILHLLQERTRANDSGSLFQGGEMDKLGTPQVDERSDGNIPAPISSDAAVWISLACKDGHHLNDGTLLTEALDVIDAMDPKGTMVHGIGVNCIAIHYAQSLIDAMVTHQLHSKSNRAIIVYPNSGEKWDPIHEKWCQGSGCTNPELFAAEILTCIRKIYDMCAREGAGDIGPMPILVGGCCRTSPETIAAIRRLVDEFLE